jgi:hypothetical protein
VAVDLICVTCETKVSVSEVAATRHKRCHVCGDPLVPLSAALAQSSAASAASIAPVALPPPPKPRPQVAPAAAPAPPRAPAAPAINFAEEFERIIRYAVLPDGYVYTQQGGIPPAILGHYLASLAGRVSPQQVLLLVDCCRAGLVLTRDFCHFREVYEPAGVEGYFSLRDVTSAILQGHAAIGVELTYGWQLLWYPNHHRSGPQLVQMFQQIGAVNARWPPPPTSFGPVAPLLEARFPPQVATGTARYFFHRARGFEMHSFCRALAHAPPGIAARDILAYYWNFSDGPASQTVLFTSRGLAVCFGDGRRFPIPYGQLAGAYLPPGDPPPYFEVVLKNGTRISMERPPACHNLWQFVELLCEIGRTNLPPDRMIEPA